MFPKSVFEFGEWLRAHPHIKRIRVPMAVMRRYIKELDSDLMFGASGAGVPVDYMFTWRAKQAAIGEDGWDNRRELFPARIYRR